MANIACPVDDKDDAIQKVSAVVASSSGIAPDHDLDGDANPYNVETNLARLLASPPGPQLQKIPIKSYVFLASIGLGLCGSIWLWGQLFMPMYELAQRMENESILGMYVYGGIGGILAAFFTSLMCYDRWSQERWRHNKEVTKLWYAETVRWNRSYYCSKHDIVFDPKTGDTASPVRMQEFLVRAYKP